MSQEQHTVTIGGVKYDYDTAMRDPVLSAKYRAAAGDPNRVTINALQKQLASATKPADVAELQATIARLSGTQNKLESAASAVASQPITAQPYDRGTYLNTDNFKEPSNAGTPAERAALDQVARTSMPLKVPAATGLQMPKAAPGISFDSIQSSQAGLDREGLARVANPTNYAAPAKVPIGGMTPGTVGSAGSVGVSSPLPSPSGAIQGSGIPAKASGTTDVMSQILKYMVPSREETDLQAQQDNLMASAKMGVNSINAEPIPYAVKYGTAKNIEDQANTKIETLSQKLARLQSARVASLQQSQFSLDRADRQEAMVKEEERFLQSQRQQAQSDALERGVTAPFYEVGGTVYRTSDNYAIRDPQEAARLGVDTNKWSNVQKVSGTSQTEKAIVADLASKYFDAGITLNDSLASAQSKAQNSRIYQDAVRPPARSGGGGGGGGSSSGGSIPKLNSKANVEKLVKQVVSESGGVNDKNRYELWDEVVKEIERQGYIPASQVDDVLWKYFHPESSKGYQQYVLGQSSSSAGVSNPFVKK